MNIPYSYDIAFLGLKEPSAAGRSMMVLTMERLTGRSTADCQEDLSKVGEALFDSLAREQAELVVTAFDEAGVLCEIRPKEEAPRAVSEGPGVSLAACPSCGYVQRAEVDECGRCGVVFSKMEKDEIQRIQRERALEEAQQRAEQIRREWDDRANQILESRPLPANACKAFEKSLVQEEIPFLVLNSYEGPMLMTSRQLLSVLEGSVIQLPYEIIKDVDFGGGLVAKKGHTRLVLHFHSPVLFNGKHVESLSWQLTAEAATNKEIIMDWAFARSYLCGACGARDMDFRNERNRTHARCMYCATDHTIDLRKNQITPLL